MNLTKQLWKTKFREDRIKARKERRLSRLDAWRNWGNNMALLRSIHKAMGRDEQNLENPIA